VAQPVRTVVLDEVGSTNREALARAQAGEAGPLWIMARRQTAGRGRSGRTWLSQPGNLHASLLVRLACPAATVPQLSLLAGVGVFDAVVRAAGAAPPAGLRLKWPNDVLVGPAKCAGILAESLPGADGIVAVIGIGINLAWHPADLGRPATHLARHGLAATPEAMLAHLAATMGQWLATWQDGAGFARVRAAWLERAGPPGEACTVDTGAERIDGAFLGLGEDGALLFADPAGRKRTVAFGDVTLGPATPGGAR
jgi:BirA family biotin operon repressor/biotin-[acetyl-CoA-carboxylase] ligase